jgi:hypothetical protein
VIPSTVQILGSQCFSRYESLSSISQDFSSHLKPIKSRAFDRMDGIIVILSTILFIAFDAVGNSFRISIADCDSCPEFDRWEYLRQSEISVDFQPILRIDSEFGGLNDYLIDDPIFEKGSMLDEFDGNSIEISHRSDDGSSRIVESISGFESVEDVRIEIENHLNLSHPCILRSIGFIFRREFRVSEDLKIVQFSSECNSLSELISMNPVW